MKFKSHKLFGTTYDWQALWLDKIQASFGYVSFLNLRACFSSIIEAWGNPSGLRFVEIRTGEGNVLAFEGTIRALKWELLFEIWWALLWLRKDPALCPELFSRRYSGDLYNG